VPALLALLVCITAALAYGIESRSTRRGNENMKSTLNVNGVAAKRRLASSVASLTGFRIEKAESFRADLKPEERGPNGARYAPLEVNLSREVLEGRGRKRGK
jgi:hypothetical protein